MNQKKTFFQIVWGRFNSLPIKGKIIWSILPLILIGFIVSAVNNTIMVIDTASKTLESKKQDITEGLKSNLLQLILIMILFEQYC